MSHYQVQRADLCAQHFLTYGGANWGGVEGSKEQLITSINNHTHTHTLLLLTPRSALLVALLSMSVSSLPYTHTHQHHWHRGAQAVKIKLSRGKHPHSGIAVWGRGLKEENNGKRQREALSVVISWREKVLKGESPKSSTSVSIRAGNAHWHKWKLTPRNQRATIEHIRAQRKKKKKKRSSGNRTSGQMWCVLQQRSARRRGDAAQSGSLI